MNDAATGVRTGRPENELSAEDESRLILDKINEQRVKLGQLKAKSLLDVVCGGGQRGSSFRKLDEGLSVDGMNLKVSLVREARESVPGSHFFAQPEAFFYLQKKYDVVTGLFAFSASGWTAEKKSLNRTVNNLGRHIPRDGMVIATPSFQPGLQSGDFYKEKTSSAVEGEKKEVLKQSHSVNNSVGKEENLISMENDTDDCKSGESLQMQTQMRKAFIKAKLSFTYVPASKGIRGMYNGTRKMKDHSLDTTAQALGGQ